MIADVIPRKIDLEGEVVVVKVTDTGKGIAALFCPVYSQSLPLHPQKVLD